MFSFLKDHPFAVEAFFETSLVLTYAVPKAKLIPLLPPCLEVDTFKEEWAFVAIALVKTKNLRPKGFPAFMGNNFILAGYRIFVRYTTSQGKKLRGLYILKSETDKKKMEVLGNIFTHYAYQTTDLDFIPKGNLLSVASKKAGLDIQVKLNVTDANLPENSPFAEWKEARRFAGPLPFTFTFIPETNEVLIIEGVRENWVPNPVEVIKHEVNFIKNSNFPNAVLANAFIIQEIPYYWRKGKKDKWLS